MNVVLAFGSGRMECSEWQTQRCSPEEIRVLLAEERGEGGMDAVRQHQPEEGRSLCHLTKESRVGDLTSGVGMSTASPASAEAICSYEGEPVVGIFTITSG